MSELVSYLNDPSLVANFQKIFGIEAQFRDRINYHKTGSKRKKSPVKVSKSDTKVEDNYKINNKFWYYLFHVGAAMGNELFYSLFFPFWFWNVDGLVARKVSVVWAIYMYVGQATKDIMEMPRPATPPVVKLEERYVKEYGFPSTHAMVAAGLPISLLVMSYSRYNINLPISIALCCAFCIWVCSSRLYLGMHSLLDVIVGVVYALTIFALVAPFLDTMDKFQLTNPYSPLVTLSIGLLMCIYYPSLRQWSTARGDTTIIVGTTCGLSLGSYLNYSFGYLFRPDEPPLYDIIPPNYFYVILRTLLGLTVFVLTRQFFKKFFLKFLCWLNGLDCDNPEAKRIKKIELPYYYITYLFIGLNITFTSPFLFRLFGIQRDYSYTEL